YDDTGIVAPLLPELSTLLNKFSVYKGLCYKAWDPVNVGGPTPGVVAQSSPNAIATTTLINQLFDGTPTITVDYPGSKSVAMDFKSFYFGCSTPTGQGAFQAARQCSILVGGFNADNQEVESATFTFTAVVTNLLRAPMVKANLPERFARVRTVTIVQTDPLTQVLLLDNASYRLYTTS
ncbi:MAG: hypothetical protein Q9224_003122, partial [Gallowayella concinna]